jgi:hypothetical protein
MARPTLQQAVIVIRTAISLRAEEDADLIAFFEQVPPRKFAAAIKTAMRSGALMNFGTVDGQDDADLAQSAADFLD